MLRPPIIIRPVPLPRTPPAPDPLPNPIPPIGIPTPPNDLDDNSDDCDEVCVYAIVPIGVPRRVRYQYPNEDPVTVEGDDWSTDITEAYNLTPRTYYQVFWTATNWFDQEIATTFPGVNFGVIGNFTIVRQLGYGVPGGIGVRVQFTDFGGTLVEQGISILTTGSIFEVGYSVNSVDALKPNTFTILSVVPVGQTSPVPIESTCRFRVYSEGQTVVDITRSVCPTVTELPETCTFDNSVRELVHRERVPKSNLNRYRYFVEISGNCARAKRALIPIVGIDINTFFAVTIVEVCSPEGCEGRPPVMNIECCINRDDCDGKKCPQGTATRVLVGGRTIQCVDANGCVLKEIPYDPKCEKADCIC
jgi:hypothetical protein